MTFVAHGAACCAIKDHIPYSQLEGRPHTAQEDLTLLKETSHCSSDFLLRSLISGRVQLSNF